MRKHTLVYRGKVDIISLERLAIDAICEIMIFAFFDFERSQLISKIDCRKFQLKLF